MAQQLSASAANPEVADLRTGQQSALEVAADVRAVRGYRNDGPARP